MKALITTLIMAMTFVATTAWAGKLQWATGLDLKDSFGLARNFDTGSNPDARGGAFGIYSGSLVGYYSGEASASYKLFGFGGVTMYASSALGEGNVKWIATATPITIFNDTFHLDIGRNFSDDATVVVLGISGTEALNAIMKIVGLGTTTATSP